MRHLSDDCYKLQNKNKVATNHKGKLSIDSSNSVLQKMMTVMELLAFFLFYGDSNPYEGWVLWFKLYISFNKCFDSCKIAGNATLDNLLSHSSRDSSYLSLCSARSSSVHKVSLLGQIRFNLTIESKLVLFIGEKKNHIMETSTCEHDHILEREAWHKMPKEKRKKPNAVGSESQSSTTETRSEVPI